VKQHLRYTILVFITTVLATALTACSSSSTSVSDMADDRAVTTTSTGTYQTLTIDEFASIISEESDEYTIMSEEASRALIELGYTQIWDVLGGMNAWQTSGRELITNDE